MEIRLSEAKLSKYGLELPPQEALGSK